MNKSFLSVTANKSEEAEVLTQQITLLLSHSEYDFSLKSRSKASAETGGHGKD